VDALVVSGAARRLLALLPRAGITAASARRLV